MTSFDPEEVAAGYGEAPPPAVPPFHVGLASSTHFIEVSGDELARGNAADHQLPFLTFCGVDGYVVEGWSHLIAAYPRTGKTELVARQVRDWIAQGHSVLYISEEARPMWEHRLRGLAGDWAKLQVVFGLGSHPASLLARAFGGPEDIVVLDAVRNLLQLQDENDNSELARITNPWVARARETGKTLVVVHHMRKGSGENGEGIAGGHAILGSFDIALELLRDSNHQRRRKVRAYCRLISPEELVYEMTEAGELLALGDPKALALDEVSDRVYGLLTGEWQPTKEIVAALGDPKPSGEQVRRALVSLARSGRIERDPSLELGEHRGKAARWRLRPSEVEFHPITKAVGTELLPFTGRYPTDSPRSSTSVPTDKALGGTEVEPMLQAARDTFTTAPS